MPTLFLGSYGYGNLGDELCLIEAVKRFNPEEAWAFSFDPEYTRRTTGVQNFIRYRAEIEQVKPTRVVRDGRRRPARAFSRLRTQDSAGIEAWRPHFGPKNAAQALLLGIDNASNS
jgi:hypothetical protein